jgi:hypothetical protein
MIEKIIKTGYEWCLEANMRILDIINWGSEKEEAYFTEKITSNEFFERIASCKVKPNSMPRKTDKYLEYRMYGLVPYNISPIQQAIQYGHAVVRYGRAIQGDKPVETIYNKWADNDETFIILNGGTTNKNPEKLGTLNVHYNSLSEYGVRVQPFYEPDLGDQLTAVVFLVDERVYDKVTYPDFMGTPFPWPSHKKPSDAEYRKWEAGNNKNYDLWVERIGGDINVFLREFLRPLRLA